MGQPEGQVQYYTREQVLGTSGLASVPVLSGLTDVFFLSSDNSINSSSTNFLTSGYASGMLIAITGSLQNNSNFLVKSVTANKMLVMESSVAPENDAASYPVGIAGTKILSANQGNKHGPKLGERQYICRICNHAFPEHLMQYFRGGWYCIPNDDYKDIASILKVEWARGYRPAGFGTNNDKVVPPIIKG